MSLTRKQIGEALKYQGRTITAHFIGPDLICHVDGIELGGFYLNVQAAYQAGKRYIDEAAKSQGKSSCP